jgi:hypothetical protein
VFQVVAILASVNRPDSGTAEWHTAIAPFVNFLLTPVGRKSGRRLFSGNKLIYFMLH